MEKKLIESEKKNNQFPLFFPIIQSSCQFHHKENPNNNQQQL